MSDEDRGTPELAAERQAARDKRREFARSPIAKFVRSMKGAMAEYIDARKDGATVDEALGTLETKLRAWPTATKFRPKCEACSDGGWVESTCRDGHRCGRPSCEKHPERTHTFTELCSCAAGDKRRPHARANGDDPMASAGRTSKRKQPTFFGRIGR